MHLRLSGILILAATTIVISGCGGNGASNNNPQPINRSQTATIWTQELLTAIRQDKIGPTPNSRAIALTTSAMYDAYALLDPVAIAAYTNDQEVITRLTPTTQNIETAVSYAAFNILKNIFPSHTSQLNARMTALGLNPNDTTRNPNTPAGIGNLAAYNIIKARENDGSNQANNYADTTGYQPVNTVTQLNDPNRWQPTPFNFPDGSTVTASFLTPQWGQVKPFALTSGQEFRCPPGAQFGTPEYISQAQEVVDYQANLTDEQMLTAEYWADGPNSETPPGHWILIAKHVSDQNQYDLKEQIKLYFLVGNAVLDAGIAAWDSKTAHDYVRPITAIRLLFANQQITGWKGPGQGFGTIDGKDWTPYQPASFITPPFAELPSGHSTFSAAAATVIRNFQGSDSLNYSVTFAPGSSLHNPGVTPTSPTTLTYSTLTSAADAAGMSRLYGGIHFMQGNLDGIEMGKQVGNAVWEKSIALFQGRRN